MTTAQRRPDLSPQGIAGVVVGASKAGRVVGGVGNPGTLTPPLARSSTAIGGVTQSGHRERWYKDPLYAENMQREGIPSDLYYNTYEHAPTEEMKLAEPNTLDDRKKGWLPEGYTPAQPPTDKFPPVGRGGVDRDGPDMKGFCQASGRACVH